MLEFRHFFPLTSAGLLRWQMALAVMVLVASVAWPGRGREALVVPLVPGSGAASLAWVVRHGGHLVGAGVIPGTLVVTSPSDRLAGVAAGFGAATLAVPSAWCGRNGVR